MTSVLWFRRDLRLRDHPALHHAAEDGPVVALFVLDPALIKPAGAPRVAFLYRSLRALDADLREHGGRLVVRRGDPVNVVPKDLELPEAGEDAALKAWKAYRGKALGRYENERDRADLDATSHMSVYLKYGAIHPRTILADLGAHDETYRQEIAWRDFYGTILATWPESAREYFQPQLAKMKYASPRSKDFTAWQQGTTGYPIVDAGMRQLLAQGWMHNRVRMIVASFLTKDLHIEWQHGARHFMNHLVDGDLASNNHGWQWTAGTGTDAAPYFRVFNPVTQGQKFDPQGDYVRRWIPELRGIEGKAVHTPWEQDEPPADYPAPIVDHKAERQEALDRYQQVRNT